MRAFCEDIKKVIPNRFGIEIDVFVSRKRRLVHFAFKQPLLGYPFYRILLIFVRKEWAHQEIFFEGYEIVFPRLISSIRWRYDYVFFQKRK